MPLARKDVKGLWGFGDGLRKQAMMACGG